MTLPIVERLRNPAGFDELLAIGHEAADTIEELVAALRSVGAALTGVEDAYRFAGTVSVIDATLTKLGAGK